MRISLLKVLHWLHKSRVQNFPSEFPWFYATGETFAQLLCRSVSTVNNCCKAITRQKADVGNRIYSDKQLSELFSLE